MFQNAFDASSEAARGAKNAASYSVVHKRFRRSASLREARGVTLLELLVALSIVALAATVVYPSFASALAEMRLRAAARQFVAACRTTRLHAMRDRIDYRMHIEREKSQILFVRADEARYQTIDLPSHVVVKEARRLTGETDRASRVTIYFYPNGTCEGGQIVLENERGRRAALQIDPLTADVKVERVATTP